MTFSSKHNLRNPFFALFVEVYAARTAGIGFRNMARLQVFQTRSIHEMQNFLWRVLTAAALRQSVFQIALTYNRRFSAVAAAIPRSVTVYLSLIRNYRKLSEPLAGQIFRFFMYAAATACCVSGGQDVARQQNLFSAITAAAPQHASIRCSLIGLFQHRQRAKPLSCQIARTRFTAAAVCDAVF